MKLKAVIIDDEQDSRTILANYLGKYCKDVEVLGFGDSVKTGIVAIEEYQPDVIFLDIEMPYGNGFDLLESIEQINFEIVFVTAYDNYAVKALNRSAAYYILKPIDIDDLINAVERIKQNISENEVQQHAKILLENLGNKGHKVQKIILPTMEGFELINSDEILYCEAEDNFTQFYFTDQRKPLLICRTLKFYEQALEDLGFLRIHRSYLVNLNFVKRYTKGKGGYITMENGKELEVSASKKKILFDSL